MGDGGKGSGEDVGTSKGPIDDEQGSHPSSDPLWEKNMVGHGGNDEGTGRFLPSDFQRDYGDNGAESRQKGMKVGPPCNCSSTHYQGAPVRPIVVLACATTSEGYTGVAE